MGKNIADGCRVRKQFQTGSVGKGDWPEIRSSLLKSNGLAIPSDPGSPYRIQVGHWGRMFFANVKGSGTLEKIFHHTSGEDGMRYRYVGCIGIVLFGIVAAVLPGVCLAGILGADNFWECILKDMPGAASNTKSSKNVKKNSLIVPLRLKRKQAFWALAR